MSHEQVIQVISKESHLRTNNEIEVILPWLRKKSTLLQGMNKDVILDVVRGCQYQRSPKEEVVIQQGDKGECFYIILKGLVSVYIDAKMSGEDEVIKTEEEKKEEAEKKAAEEQPGDTADGENGDNPDGDQSSQGDAPPAEANTGDSAESGDAKETKPKPGKMKGLFKKKTLTNMVKKITHQARQKKNVERKALGKFIVRFETGRSFGEIALLSEDNVRNASIIADDDTDFLVIHRDLYNSTLKAFQEKEFRDVKEFIESQPLFFDWPQKFLNLLQMSIRKETYSIMSPIVTQGQEVDGLVFILRGQSKIVVEPSRHRSQYPERLPFKDKSTVFEDDDFMRSRFGKKSSHGTRPRRGSVSTLKQKQIVIRRSQGYAAAEKKAFQRTIDLCYLVKGDVIGDVETVMNLSTYASTVLCTAETQVYILDSKNFDRLITKKNPDTLNLLRELVEIKLKNRVSTSQGSQIPLMRHLYFDLTRKTEEVIKKQVVTRNTKELPDQDILLQHLLDWFVQRKAPLIQPYVPGNVYYKNLMQERARIRASVRQQQLKMERRPTVAVLPNTLRKQFADRKPRSISALKDAMKKLRSTDVSVILSPRRPFLYQGGQDIKEEEGDEQESPRASSPKVKIIPFIDNLSVPTPPAEDKRKDSMVRFEDETTGAQVDSLAIETISDANTSLPPLDINDNAPVFVTESADRNNFLPPIGDDELGLTNLAKDVFLAPGEYDDDELNLPSIDGQSSRLRFYNEYVRHKLNTLEEDPEFNDYETSDQTLSFLETRLQNFLARNVTPGRAVSEDSQRQDINLPKLKRFSCENPTLNAPRRGGRVMVKKHACKFAHCNFVVKGHRHAKYFMVDELPETETRNNSVKQTQMVMNVLMGGLVQRKKSQSAKTPNRGLPS